MSHEFSNYKISVYEPFADYLLAAAEEKKFEITLLDVVRFAGHACPSMVGAFLIAQRVTRELFPETNVCVRGEVEISFPDSCETGPTGPIANVFGFVFGAWSKTGFGGLKEQFVRRNLVQFDVPNVAPGTILFRHLPSQKEIKISYRPSEVSIEAIDGETFQQQWRRKIQAILLTPEVVRIC